MHHRVAVMNSVIFVKMKENDLKKSVYGYLWGRRQEENGE
jgi:hypothetical protein